MFSAVQTQKFISLLVESLSLNSFIKISLGNYKGKDEALKQILIRRVIIKQEEKLAFTYRYKTRDEVKNYPLADAINMIKSSLTDGFKIATLFTVTKDLILEELNNGKVVQRELEASAQALPLSHDLQKSRLIKPETKPYLHALNITDTAGKVYKNTQDKFRQINHYIEILSALIKELPEGTVKKVADMGAGKGYLTFALYDYLHTVLQVNAAVVGVEYRPDLVSFCNNVAEEAGFKQLHFEQGTIENYNTDEVNLLIALHACDTATDDAICKGIKANAELIVVAPCCHKQIRRELEKNKIKNDISFLTQHGIFLERQAEMLTDGIRALILEYFGYKTKIFEFISDAHTPKNVLVVGIKKNQNHTSQAAQKKQAEILQKIKNSKAYFGIGYHHLERLMGL